MNPLEMVRMMEAINSRWPSRRILEAKIPSKHRSAGGVLKTVKSSRVGKDKSKTMSHLYYDLSPEQLQQAKYLANILPGRQRPCAQLLEKMREKQITPVEIAREASSTSPAPTSLARSVAALASPAPRGLKATDWEADALETITIKKLSLDTEWSLNTWKNKTNVEVRLKLLKDDGYDITPLQAKGVTSDQITEAILAHIALRRKRKAAAVLLAADQDDVEYDSEGQEVMESIEVDFGQTAEPGEIPRGPSSFPARTENMPIATLNVHGTRVPSSLAPQKRKFDHEDDLELGRDSPSKKCAPRSLCTSGPPTKRMRVSTPEESNKKVEEEAFDQFKNNIIRKIFSTSQTTQTDFGTKPPTLVSCIVFKSPDPSPTPRAKPDAIIGTRGCGRIFEELKCLSSGRAEDGSLVISNPDIVDVQPHDSIRIHQSSQSGFIIYGDAYALVGLMKRLRKHDLTHTSEWVFNGMEIVAKGNISWSLSKNTSNQLARIEGVLQAGVEHGVVEARVEQVYDGKRLYFD